MEALVAPSGGYTARTDKPPGPNRQLCAVNLRSSLIANCDVHLTLVLLHNLEPGNVEQGPHRRSSHSIGTVERKALIVNSTPTILNVEEVAGHWAHLGRFADAQATRRKALRSFSTSLQGSTLTPCKHPIRCVTIDGRPWFVAADTCKHVGLSNTTMALRPLKADQKGTIKRIEVGMTAGPDLNIVSESGLYALVMRSDKPQAKAFQSWVTGTVLPAIRKDGRLPAPGCGS